MINTIKTYSDPQKCLDLMHFIGFTESFSEKEKATMKANKDVYPGKSYFGKWVTKSFHHKEDIKVSLTSPDWDIYCEYKPICKSYVVYHQILGFWDGPHIFHRQRFVKGQLKVYSSYVKRGFRENFEMNYVPVVKIGIKFISHISDETVLAMKNISFKKANEVVILYETIGKSFTQSEIAEMTPKNMYLVSG